MVRESSAYEVGTEAGKWDVPGGRIEPQEEVQEGLLREVKEESGLNVKPGELLGIMDGFSVIEGDDCHVVRIYFLCEATTDEVKLSQDHDDYDWVDPTAMGDKILVSGITEMLEVASKHL